MLKLFGKKVLHSAKFAVPKVEVLQLHVCPYSSLATAERHKSGSENVNPPSFAANYLVKNFGFSEERAQVSSRHANFRSSENADLVVSFLEKHGFSDAQISRLVTKIPTILLLKPDSNLLPKMEFFRSLGISNDEVTKILTSGRSLLARGLNGQIIPSFLFIKNLLKSHEDAMDTIKRFPNILQLNLQNTVPHNVESLQKIGVPEAKILHVFKYYPRFLLITPDKFRECVALIQEMGFNPLSTTFVTGIYVKKMLSSSNWKKKIEVYKRWGYSESQVLAAFKLFPWFMTVSEDKINRVMDHVINRMGCDRFLLLGRPYVLSLSMERTILPRSSAFKILKSRGLLRKNASFIAFLKHSKKSFLKKYVTCYAEEIPELLKLFPK